MKTEYIDRFFKRYHSAVMAGNKDLTMSMENATNLASEIQQLLTKLLSKPVEEKEEIIQVVMDGGRIP